MPSKPDYIPSLPPAVRHHDITACTAVDSERDEHSDTAACECHSRQRHVPPSHRRLSGHETHQRYPDDAIQQPRRQQLQRFRYRRPPASATTPRHAAAMSAILHEECRRGAHLPSLGRELVGG